MNTAVQQHIPEGYLEDQAGRLVPVSKIDEIDLTRNDLVGEIVGKALALQRAMAEFKLATLGDIEAFIDLGAERYDVQVGGKKGNVTLTSFDGRYKIQRAISENLVFDERLQVAKELIDQCINRWAQGSAAEIRALVTHAFQVDKEGKISTGRVLGLRRLAIEDVQWRQAMDAIADSIQVTGSKTYIRLYERVGPDDQFRPISLDLAAL
ncbi:DUF3164 family protein [Marinobacterium rhizophilum]|uniref:DUF3164 family protein n=1 Tax=Marinobacterium rhizophilum TaxID=420402 RepID=A0ABY5HKX5_9GAMM|nr:DUF3164 family protein [Marinobacterium rhizophilum]UTW12955.1 DUF3164 family protein [Marinobacterium rhizophilum]